MGADRWNKLPKPDDVSSDEEPAGLDQELSSFANANAVEPIFECPRHSAETGRPAITTPQDESMLSLLSLCM